MEDLLLENLLPENCQDNNGATCNCFMADWRPFLMMLAVSHDDSPRDAIRKRISVLNVFSNLRYCIPCLECREVYNCKVLKNPLVAHVRSQALSVWVDL